MVSRAHRGAPDIVPSPPVSLSPTQSARGCVRPASTPGSDPAPPPLASVLPAKVYTPPSVSSRTSMASDHSRGMSSAEPDQKVLQTAPPKVKGRQDAPHSPTSLYVSASVQPMPRGWCGDAGPRGGDPVMTVEPPDGMTVHVKEIPREPPPPLQHGSTQQEDIHPRTRKKGSPDPESAGTLTLDAQPPQP